MSFIQLSKSNYFHNLKLVLDKVQSINQIAVVLKDNSYGHGLIPISKLASEFGIKRAVVRNLQEAIEIEQFFDYILILAPDKFQENPKFHFTLNSLEDLEKIIKLNLSTKLNFELKIDTGMHRFGISLDEVQIAIQIIKKYNINLKGVFTHFRDADDKIDTYFNKQVDEFQKVKNIFRREFQNLLFHSHNSAALFRQSGKISDEIVRVGIATYGYLPVNYNKNIPEFKPVLSLWAKRIGGLKKPKEFFKPGYGGILELGNQTKLSIYDIGYADGFRRLPDEIIQKKQFKTVSGHYLLGRVSMDSIILNTNLKQVQIFSSVSELAKMVNTIEYEILVGLSDKIHKIII